MNQFPDLLLIVSTEVGLPCGSAAEESAHNAGGLRFDPWIGKILLQYSGLEYSMDLVHGPSKESDTPE